MTMSDRLAVMRHGKIEQIGAPEEVYENPATEFVARFLGASNLLDGTLEHGSGGTSTVRLAIGGSVALPSARAPFASGARVRVGVRPEKVMIGPERDPAPADRNAVVGDLRMATYVGIGHQYAVEVAPDLEMTAWVQNIADGANVPVGRVRLSWAREHTFAVLPQEGLTAEEGDGE